VERVLAALQLSMGAQAADGLRLDNPSGLAMLAVALTGRDELVLQDADETAGLRPSIPAQMYWVWGIPSKDLTTAAHVSQFMHFASLFHLIDRYQITFVKPDGEASVCPILYGITSGEQAGEQLYWLATGDGRIPL
jgi:hypothetical protein